MLFSNPARETAYINLNQLTEDQKEFNFHIKLFDFKGSLVFDTTKPDGTPRKLLDTSKINNLGWKPSITLKDGIRRTIAEVADLF